MDKIKILSVNEDAEKLKPLDIVDSSVNWPKYFWKQFESIYKI